MQMGHTASIFVVTEGTATDRWFYDMLLQGDERLARLGVRVYTVESATRGLPGSGSGKTAVLKLFQTLRSLKGLALTNSSGHKALVFCVDSDHDRILGRMFRSDHLIYTELPDVEAHVIQSCELTAVVSAVTSIPLAEAKQVMRNLSGWERRFAADWQEWFSLCCAGFSMSASNCPYPGTPPSETVGRFGPPSEKSLNSLRKSISAQCKSSSALEAAELKYRSRVEESIRRGRAHRLLKGKWCLKYLAYVVPDAIKELGGGPVSMGSESLLAAAKMSAKFDSKWCTNVRSKVARTVGILD